jgi:hypothetical protein
VPSARPIFASALALVLAAVCAGCAARPAPPASTQPANRSGSQPTSSQPATSVAATGATAPTRELPEVPTPGRIDGTLAVEGDPRLPESAVIFAEIVNAKGSRISSATVPISGSQPWPFSIVLDSAKVKPSPDILLRVSIRAAHGVLYSAELPLFDEGETSPPSGIELMALPAK